MGSLARRRRGGQRRWRSRAPHHTNTLGLRLDVRPAVLGSADASLSCGADDEDLRDGYGDGDGDGDVEYV